jgi:hypothetical protein
MISKARRRSSSLTIRVLHLELRPSKPATFAYVNISDDLPNGPHLEVNDTIELRAGDTQVASSSADTTLSASESRFAHIDGQLGNPHADASCHVLCYRFGIVRQPRPPALPALSRCLVASVRR